MTIIDKSVVSFILITITLSHATSLVEQNSLTKNLKIREILFKDSKKQ